jgi:hypothetical protein
MPCDISCDQCQHLQQCGGAVEDEQNRKRSCNTSCAHYDELNCCCWQSGPWGLFFSVYDGDDCHLGYMENDFR